MRSPRRYIFHIILLILVGTGVYWNSLDNGFVYDDLVTVEENYFIRDWKNLARVFSRDYYVRAEEYSFRPLVTLTYFSDRALFGGDPRGYHLTNLILHLLAGLAAYFLAGRISGKPLSGFLLALLFLVHPALTEAVNGISFREDILCALFCFLALLAYAKSGWRGRVDRKLYALSLFCFLLALLAKEMAVALPLVITAYLLLVQKRHRPELLRPSLLVFFLIALFYGVARLAFLFQSGTPPAAPEFGNPAARLVLVLKSLGLYGRLAFLPVNLTVEYPDPLPPVIWSDYLILPALFTTGFLLAAWIRGKNPIARFGLAFFFLSCLPILNLVPSARIGAERFLYLPLFGFLLWGVETLTDLRAGRKARNFVAPIAVLILYLLGTGTIRRNRDWADNLTLFSRAVEVSPLSSKAHHGLGNEYFRLGRTGEAIEQFREAINIFNREPLFYNSLGVAYGEEGRFDLAREQFQLSAALNPGDPLVRLNLSTLFLRAGDTVRAREEIGRFISERPFDPSGYLNLGEIHLAREDCRSAIDAFSRALAIDPSSLPALTGLGFCHYRQGDEERARLYWKRALEIDPDNLGMRRNLELVAD